MQHPEPSPADCAQAEKVQKAICAELNLAAREGAPVAALLAGAGAAIADLITCQAGADKVAPWFEGQAELVRFLQSKS